MYGIDEYDKPDVIQAPAPRKKRAEAITAELPELPDTATIAEMALSVEQVIFMTYYNIMTDPDAQPAIRKACADALADRARGRPSQSIDISTRGNVENNISITITHVRPDAPPTGSKPEIDGVCISLPPPKNFPPKSES